MEKLKRLVLISTLLIIPTHYLLSNSVRQDDTTYIDDVEMIQPIYEDNLDSLLNLYYMQQGDSNNDFPTELPAEDTLSDVKLIPDSVYIQRLLKIPSGVKLTYNQIVRRYIEMYTQRKKDKVQRMLGLAEYYFPIFDDIFDYYGLPNELKYMSIIESALNPRARSRTRAVGIWQFMYGTGKLYGLTINGLVDERRDPIKATHAAAQFSKDLYDIFQDWQLVIAAYNCGPGNVSRAIRRSGGKRDFWEIYPYLPRETRGHVPAFIAAVYTMNYYKEHNIIPLKVDLPYKIDTIVIRENVHFAQIAEVLQIPIELLRDLNPQYIRDIIPGKISAYPLVLPVDYIGKFIDLSDKIYAFKDSIYFNINDLLKEPNYTRKSKNGKIIYSQKPPKGYTRIVYTVKQGDNLGSIAERYRVRVNDILDWNNLYSTRIKAGQKIYILVPQKSTTNLVEKSNKVEEKPQIKNNNTDGSQTKSSKVNNNKTNEQFIYYTVKQGDTLWDIIKKYPGITLNDLEQWNNLSDHKIFPGQQLKIKIM